MVMKQLRRRVNVNGVLYCSLYALYKSLCRTSVIQIQIYWRGSPKAKNHICDYTSMVFVIY